MSNYPNELDTELNLPTAHDSLRLTLAEDYLPGDRKIYATGDSSIFLRFPDSGYITLTEQCSDVAFRAISFHYTGKTAISDVMFTFDGLSLLENFVDSAKPKRLTHITQNVMAEYHNGCVEAIKNIQAFVGKKGTIDPEPYGPTMEGRTNFLHKLVLQPRAWFTADTRYGLVPLEVTFTNKSFQIGEGCPVEPVEFIWDFGDGDISRISHISVASFTAASNIDAGDVSRLVETGGQYPYSGTVTKVYNDPAKYDVSLTVINKWGQDTIVFPNFVVAKLPAPDEATIDIVARSGQILTNGDPQGGPPFTTYPKLRAAINTFIDVEIQDGVKPDTQSIYAPYGRSYAGEILDSSGFPIDPVVDYNWQLSDDLAHGNAKIARASYSIGGSYDLTLRTDTEFGAYRITTYKDVFDIIENSNLWLWTFVNGTNDVVVNEFGLISETFKTRPVVLSVDRDASFLQNQTNSPQLTREFNRNVFFSPMTQNSGSGGTALIYWASGRSGTEAASNEKINYIQFNGFNDSYFIPVDAPEIYRPWNWVAFNINSANFFLLGNTVSPPAPNTSPTNQDKLMQSLMDFSTSSTTMIPDDYLGSADELMNNVCVFDDAGQPTQGHFSAYRATTKSQTGYFVRNSGVGPFFRLRSFYKTEGILSDPIQKIKKLPDMLGTTKLEGQLVSLTSGVFFFDNSSSLSAYNDSSGVWETGAAGADSAAFSSLQDRSVIGFSRYDNPLLATSDGDRRAYLSYDYSPSAFVKFSEATLAFTSLINRPSGEQWLMATY